MNCDKARKCENVVNQYLYCSEGLHIRCLVGGGRTAFRTSDGLNNDAMVFIQEHKRFDKLQKMYLDKIIY